MRRWKGLKPTESAATSGSLDLLVWRKQTQEILSANGPFWDSGLEEVFRSFEEWLARVESIDTPGKPWED